MLVERPNPGVNLGRERVTCNYRIPGISLPAYKSGIS
jgi:hypothetical protein